MGNRNGLAVKEEEQEGEDYHRFIKIEFIFEKHLKQLFQKF